jgi:hypothetical protein
MCGKKFRIVSKKYRSTVLKGLKVPKGSWKIACMPLVIHTFSFLAAVWPL